MTRDYLQNWISWALHQPTPPDEVHRVKKALQLAAEAQGLTLESAFTEPGSIDAFPLSVEGHPLLLKPNMVVGPPKSVENGTSPLYCCAVPKRFYEVRANFDCYLVVGNKKTITYFHFFLLHLHLHKSFTSCILSSSSVRFTAHCAKMDIPLPSKHLLSSMPASCTITVNPKMDTHIQWNFIDTSCTCQLRPLNQSTMPRACHSCPNYYKNSNSLGSWGWLKFTQSSSCTRLWDNMTSPLPVQ